MLCTNPHFATLNSPSVSEASFILDNEQQPDIIITESLKPEEVRIRSVYLRPSGNVEQLEDSRAYNKIPSELEITRF